MIEILSSKNLEIELWKMEIWTRTENEKYSCELKRYAVTRISVKTINYNWCKHSNNNNNNNSHRIKLKECEKKVKYIDLARELKKLWNMKITIILIVIGAFGTVTKGLLKSLGDLEFGDHPNYSIIENG